MAVTTASTNTQTATVTTEHTLFDTTAAATYQLAVDTVNMVAGDVIELRVYKMVLTGGTRRVVYLYRCADVQPTDDLIKISVPISNELTDTNALRFSLKQTVGTGRAFPWKVLTYG